MTVRQTSLDTYYDLYRDGHISYKQAQVLKLIVMNPDSTDRELAKIMDTTDPNVVRPRRNELAAKGLIYETGSRPCTITGRKAITWRAF